MIVELRQVGVRHIDVDVAGDRVSSVIKRNTVDAARATDLRRRINLLRHTICRDRVDWISVGY